MLFHVEYLAVKLQLFQLFFNCMFLELIFVLHKGIYIDRSIFEMNNSDG